MQNKIIQNNNHTFMNFVEELKWRGMIHQMMPGTEEQLQKEMTVAYLGIDPTADSLHIGHLVGVMMLKHLQRAGSHKPIALVGGATGMIGDPSMKSQERKLLDEQTLRHNQEAIKRQLAKFLDFDSTEPNAAELVNNYDWMKQFSFLDFIRDVGKHITVNYMMAKDSVKKRLSGESQQECRSPNSPINSYRATTSSAYTATRDAACSSADPISGATSPPAPNSYAALSEVRPSRNYPVVNY